MIRDDASSFPRIFRLEDEGVLILDRRGFQHPAALRWLAPVYTPYSDIRHVAAGRRSIRFGTPRSVFILNRQLFRSEHEADEFLERLLHHVAEQPDGPARIARMRALDDFAIDAPYPIVTRGLLALLGLVWLLQLAYDPAAHEAGFFNAALVRAGETWRLVTANLLHAAPVFPVHLFLNGLGLLVLGTLLEWSLGARRTLVIMAASALGAMGAGLLVDYEDAVGASGIVMGVVGALVFLEFRYGEGLPAQWRLPRALIWLGVALQFGLELMAKLFFPIIASGAHVGGFVLGFLFAATLSTPGLRRAPRPPWLRTANVAVVAALVLSLLASGRSLVAFQGNQAEVFAQRAERLLLRAEAHPVILNNTAWHMATRDDATPRSLAVAQKLAERAVEATERQDPQVLDTLAEIRFRLGDDADARRLIDEAIALAPAERYYREQRERFRGERPRDEIPEPPDPTDPLPTRPGIEV